MSDGVTPADAAFEADSGKLHSSWVGKAITGNSGISLENLSPDVKKQKQERVSIKFRLPDLAGRSFRFQHGSESREIVGNDMNHFISAGNAPIMIAQKIVALECGKSIRIGYGGSTALVTRVT